MLVRGVARGITVLFAFTSALAAADFTQIPRDRQAVLTGDWTPSREQTVRTLSLADTAVQAQLVHYAQDEKATRTLREMQRHASDYHVQFRGIKHRDKQIIRCTFFLMRDQPSRSRKYWRDNQVVSRCWFAWYDVSRDRLFYSTVDARRMDWEFEEASMMPR
jgi:hypothetical protein